MATGTAVKEIDVTADRPAPKPQPKRLGQGQMRQPGEAFVAGSVFVVPDAEFDLALSDPNYLGLYASRLHRLDEVTVVAASGVRKAKCTVTFVDEHGARVKLAVDHLFNYPSIDSEHSDLDDLFQIRDDGFADGYSIIRRADGAVLKKGVRTWSAALDERRRAAANQASAAGR